MLTDAQMRRAEKADKPYKLSDTGGLYLYVTVAGGKLWRLKYRLGQGTCAVDRPLSRHRTCRRTCDDSRSQAAAAGGQRPSRKATPALDGGDGEWDTFEAIAREWHAINKGQGSTCTPMTCSTLWSAMCSPTWA
jgi:hypothetical protein